MEPRLSALQRRILAAAAGLEPPFVLTGGGALAVYIGHRDTRDLDLFWRGRATLDRELPQVEERLRRDGLSVTRLRHDPAFAQLRVSDGTETTTVDLVADPTPTLEAPRTVFVGQTAVLADSPHEILVNKLSALLGRLEVRDLLDVRALLASGGDLARALEDAPRKDAGFSALTLAWVLTPVPVESLASSSGLSAQEAHELARFRDDLVRRLTGTSASV